MIGVNYRRTFQAGEQREKDGSKTFFVELRLETESYELWKDHMTKMKAVQKRL